MIHRRSFITGLISLVAAPAIVRAGSLMPVKVMVEPYGVGPMMSAVEIINRALIHAAEREINPPWRPPPYLLVSPSFKAMFDEVLAE